MAKLDSLVHIDFNKNEILNAKLQNLATAPTVNSSDVGFIYWNITDNTAYCWTGTAWIDLGQLHTHPLFPGTAQPTTPLSGAQVISQITLDNGHVTNIQTRTLSPGDIGAALAVHTHAFGQITGLPTNTILGNVTGSTGPAQALTQSQVLSLMGIAYGTLALLTAGTDTVNRTWQAKDLNDWINVKLGNYLTVVNLALGARTATTMPITNSGGTGVTLPVATTTLAGLMSAADKVKLDGIATGANNYVHPTNNPGVHPFTTLITSGLQVLSQMIVNAEGHVTTIASRNLTAADIASVMINDAINNGTNTTWSSSKIYAELQVAIGQAQTGALVYQPTNYTPSATSGAVTAPPPITSATIKSGMVWVVTTSGFFGTDTVEPGDMVIAKIDNAGTTATNYQIINKNIPAIVSATTLVEGIIFLATAAEAIAGTDATKAITPVTLKAALDAQVKGYVANFGNSSATAFTITHGLNTQDVQVQVQRLSDRKWVLVEWAAPTVTTVTINVNVAPATNSLRVIIKPV